MAYEKCDRCGRDHGTVVRDGLLLCWDCEAVLATLTATYGRPKETDNAP